VFAAHKALDEPGSRYTERHTREGGDGDEAAASIEVPCGEEPQNDYDASNDRNPAYGAYNTGSVPGHGVCAIRHGCDDAGGESFVPKERDDCTEVNCGNQHAENTVICNA